MALLAPMAAAQTLTNPITGEFTDVYVVTGRAVDALGNPVARGEIVVELDQEGVRAEPLRASTDCFGVYITSFGLRNVRDDGKVRVTVKGDGLNATAEAPLDSFYRRTDLNVKYEGRWPTACPDQTPLWKNRVTFTGRIVFRTEPYEDEGVTYHATPFSGRLQMVYDDGEERTCPPSAINPTACDQNQGQLDERGDFRYSWVFHTPVNVTSEHRVELRVANQTHRIEVDPFFRIATLHLDTSGRGPPERVEAPAASALVVGIALAAAALLARSRR